MSKDYGSWSLQDLKSELRRRNARITGKKAVLIQRLEDYDKIFGPLVTDPESCFKIELPSPDSFRDLTSHSEMPMLTGDDLNTFCELTEREDIITSENMYRENFLCSCRVALVDGHYYITGLCASEMRKNVTYCVTFKAKDHIILEAQCECAAGIGPYAQCKHILVLIYCAIDFTKNKKINIRSACTSRLQTFHHPSTSYTGNPIMAKDLTLKFKNKRMNEITSFDPRPSVEDAEKFQENFKSLVANYSGEGHGMMPIAQIIKPADKRSLYKEHDYLEKTVEETYFESLIKSHEELEELKFNIERRTWLQDRKLRLQSSDFKKIISCAPANKHKLAKCLLMSSAELQTPAIKHGRKYEPKAIEKFQELTGLKVHKCGIIVHPEHQFLGSTPDGLLENEEILEVKCPYTARHNSISGATVPFIYLCEESGNFKLKETHQYYYQVQGQLFCSQKKWANFFIFTFSDFCLIRIARDELFINNMTEQLQSFYNDYYKLALSNRFLYSNHI